MSTSTNVNPNPNTIILSKPKAEEDPWQKDPYCRNCGIDLPSNMHYCDCLSRQIYLEMMEDFEEDERKQKLEDQN